MVYTAIIFCTQPGGGDSFTFSLETTTDDCATVYRELTQEAGVSDDEVDTILVLKNGETAPEVIRHWRAANGDFEGL